MTQKAFRFLHAADLHLEQPVQGLADVPEHLRDLLIDAPYAAAAKVFETAVVEEVEFLVLSGDVLDVRYAGPRGPVFLAEQFERLAAEEIRVFWAGSPLEPPDAWPESLLLPGNVARFPLNRVAEHLIDRGGESLARLVGISRDGARPLRPSDFEPDLGGLFTVAAVYGEGDAAAMQSRGIHYWALGGRHERGVAFGGPTLAYCPGTPQGRRADEVGPHGCALVHVEGQAARTTAVATDVVRWNAERLLVDEATTLEALRARWQERIEIAMAGAAGLDLLMGWTIGGRGPLLDSLRRAGAIDELLAWLRRDFGAARPAAWTTTIELDFSGALPAEWYEQESLRGDFLRVLRQYEVNAEQSLDLEQFVGESHMAGELGVIASLGGPQRAGVLREAALLGVDLLSGEDQRP